MPFIRTWTKFLEDLQFNASWNMTSKMITPKTVFTSIKFLLLSILFVICFFFVKSVFDDYASKASNMKRSLKKYDKLKFPTILYCIDPAMKQSAMGITYESCDLDHYYLNNFVLRKCNHPMGKVLNDSGFTIDLDYGLFMYNITAK